MAEGNREAIRADDEVVSVAEVRELQRALRKKTMEIEILCDAMQIAHEKTDLALMAFHESITNGYSARSVAVAKRWSSDSSALVAGS